MITSMTDEQKNLVPVYRDKWLKDGRRTKTFDKDKVKSAINLMYKIAGESEPKYIIYMDSPIQCEIACNLIKNTKFDEESNLGSNLWSNLESNLGSNLWSNLGSNLWSNLRSNLGSNLESNLGSNLGSNLESNLRSNLRSNLWSNLRSNLGSNLESNLESNLGSNLWSNLGSNLWSNLRSNLGSNLESNLGSNLGSNLESNLRSNLRSNLWSNLRSNLGSNLESNLRSNLRSNLWSNLRSNLGSNLESNLGSNLGSNLEYFDPTYNACLWYNAGYYGFYDFILNELFPEQKENFKLFYEFTEALKELHMVWMYKDICFVSDFPEEINLDSEGRLSSYDRPAMLYRDGYALFYINGIKMNKEQIETPKEKFTKDMILSEINVDRRRCVIQKIGIEKAIAVLGAKTVDTYESSVGGKYELLMIDYDGRGQARPYLKMKNLSLEDVFHIEGVHPSVKSVKEAICFRNKLTKFIEPDVLS